MCVLTLYCMKVINPIWDSWKKYLEKYSGLKFMHTNLFFFQPFHIYQFSMGFIIIYCYTGFTCNNNNNNNNNNNIIIIKKRNFTLLKTIKSYNLRMKIKQLVIFTILNYISIRKYLHNFKKTELYDQWYFLILHL